VTLDDPRHEGGLLGLGWVEMPHPLQQIDHQFLFRDQVGTCSVNPALPTS